MVEYSFTLSYLPVVIECCILCMTPTHLCSFGMLASDSIEWSCVQMMFQGPEKEAQLAEVTARIAEICGKRGIMIK